MLENEKTSPGIRLLTLSTSIRWFGWGLVEAFIPVFLLTFSTNFLETGILASVYSIVFLFSIPFAGYLADNIKIKRMILISLILYMFIGTGYFLAGLMNAMILILLSRTLNGVAYSLDQVGRESYFIKHSPKGAVSNLFGRFDVITNFWWIIGVVIGLLLVEFMSVPIYWLFFAVAPTSLISFFIVLRLKEKEKKRKSERKKVSLLKVYLNLFKDIKRFGLGLKIILFLSFLTGALSSIIYFFVPISSYLNGGGLISSAILALTYTTPILFAKFLGKIADKKRERGYLISFFFIILISISLIFTKDYITLLIIMFVSSMTFELISLTNKGMLARFADPTHLGEADGSLNGVAALGAVIGPILFGFLLDSVNPIMSYLMIVFISIVALIVSFIGSKKHLKTT